MVFSSGWNWIERTKGFSNTFERRNDWQKYSHPGLGSWVINEYERWETLLRKWTVQGDKWFDSKLQGCCRNSLNCDTFSFAISSKKQKKQLFLSLFLGPNYVFHHIYYMLNGWWSMIKKDRACTIKQRTSLFMAHGEPYFYIEVQLKLRLGSVSNKAIHSYIKGRFALDVNFG